MCCKAFMFTFHLQTCWISILGRLLIKQKAHGLPWANANNHSAPDQSHHESRDRAFRAAQFPSSLELLVLKNQELNLSMEYPSLLFLVTCDRLFFALHFGEQRVCCILIWCWSLQRQQASTSSDQLCVSLTKVYKMLPLHQEILEVNNVAFLGFIVFWWIRGEICTSRALEKLWKWSWVWVISKDSCLLDISHLPGNGMIRRLFCWGLVS